jgi:hypothetical protein
MGKGVFSVVETVCLFRKSLISFFCPNTFILRIAGVECVMIISGKKKENYRFPRIRISIVVAQFFH